MSYGQADLFAQDGNQLPESQRSTIRSRLEATLATLETRTAMGMLAVDNLAAHFAGRPCPSRVA